MSRYIDGDQFWKRITSKCEEFADLETIEEELDDMPTADVVEIKRGRWETFSPLSRPRCSVCGELCIGTHAFDYTLTDYCPNCGALMTDEVKE